MMKTHTKKNSFTKRNNNLMVVEWSCSSNVNKENEEKSVSNNMYHAICVVCFFFAVRLSTGRHSFSDVTTNSLDCHFTNAYILFFWLLDIYVNWIISEPLNICVTAFFLLYSGVQSILQWFCHASVFVYVGFFPNHPHRSYNEVHR